MNEQQYLSAWKKLLEKVLLAKTPQELVCLQTKYEILRRRSNSSASVIREMLNDR